MRMSDNTSNNAGWDPDEHCQVGTLYRIKFECLNGMISLYLNGVKKTSRMSQHLQRFHAPIWVSNPWYAAANVTISNLNIYGSPQPVSKVYDILCVLMVLLSFLMNKSSMGIWIIFVNEQTLLSWAGGVAPVKGQCIGRVNIGTNFAVVFDLVVHGIRQGWHNIIHIGDSDGQRSPGFWLYPGDTKLHARMSDTQSANQGYDPAEKLQIGTLYRVKLEGVNGTISLYLNGIRKTTRTAQHIQRNNAQVWAGDPWYGAANVTVSNLAIYDGPAPANRPSASQLKVCSIH